MATAAGLSGDSAVKFGEDLVGAAADLGSFWNFDPSQVAADIQSGLAGESEPLRKYNIYLTEASVKAKAMEMGLVDANGQISEQNKVLARQALIMDQLGPAAGDFAETSDGLANSTRILKQQFANIVAQMGLYLLPFVNRLAVKAKELLVRFDKLSDSTKKMIVIFLGVAAALGPVLVALGFILPALALLSAPILLIIALIALLAVAWAKNWGDIRGKTEAVIKFFTPLIDIIMKLGHYFYDVVTNKIQPGNLAKLPKWLQPIAFVLGRIIKSIRVFILAWKRGGIGAAFGTLAVQGRALVRALDKLAESLGLTRLWNTIKRIFGDIGKIIGDAVAVVKDIIHGKWKKAWDDLSVLAKDGLHLLFDVLGLLWEGVKAVFDAIPWQAIGTSLWNGIVSAFNAIDWTNVGSTIWDGLTTAFNWVKETALPTLGTWGLDLIEGLWSDLDWSSIGSTIWTGLQTAFGAVVDFAVNAASWMAGKGKALLDALWNLDWHQVAVDVWNGVWTAIQEVATLGKIALNAVIDLGGDLAALRDNAGDWLTKAIGWTGDKTLDIGGKLILDADVVINDTSTGQDDGGGWKDKLGNFAKGIPGAIVSAIKASFNLGTDIADLASWIAGKVGDALAFAFQNLTLEKVGIALGIVLGGILLMPAVVAFPFLLAESFMAGFVTELIGNFADAIGLPLRQWAGQIIDVVKKAFGIASPSTVFAAIGASLATGLIVGININQIFTFFASLGRAVIGGIMSGINSLWNAFVGVINEIFRQILIIRYALNSAAASANQTLQNMSMSSNETSRTPSLTSMSAVAGVSSSGGASRSVVVNFQKGSIVATDILRPARAAGIGGIH
jgi:HAMP domain-containing protein